MSKIYPHTLGYAGLATAILSAKPLAKRKVVTYPMPVETIKYWDIKQRGTI